MHTARWETRGETRPSVSISFSWIMILLRAQFHRRSQIPLRYYLHVLLSRARASREAHLSLIDAICDEIFVFSERARRRDELGGLARPDTVLNYRIIIGIAKCEAHERANRFVFPFIAAVALLASRKCDVESINLNPNTRPRKKFETS